MSWLLNLYETYQSNIDRIGKIEKKYNEEEYTLLPISHTTQNAHIEVEITENGDFHSATVIKKNNASTLIPCTEDSASRTSNIIAYPLHDKLSYVAGDFAAYSGEEKYEDHFKDYIEQLGDWANSPYATTKVKSIYNYLSKKKLIADLIGAGILYVDENKRLINKWNKRYEHLIGEKPEIFSIAIGGQYAAFVRFTVHSPDKILSKTWQDKEMYDSFISYYKNLLGNDGYCYVKGEILPTTERHANKIRHAGDKAKLISSNDTAGFTFRGRFKESYQVAGISYEVSQKAHNALKWLINRQGKTFDTQVFLIWGNDDLDIPDPWEDSLAIGSAIIHEKKRTSFTNQELANEVAKAMDGYRGKLESKSDVNILILDSATEGRMAVVQYRNMDKELYLDRLGRWHSTCIWLHRYRKDEQGKYIQYYGAPALKDIAFAVYSPRADAKIVKGLRERMLPCIIDEKSIPLDITKNAFQRASNPVAMESWEWEKTFSIACALINKKEGYDVALDTENTHRDYLFGRLLAIADVLERRALNTDEKRTTNAIRYMNSFSRHPARTWKIIQESLQPYQARLGAQGIYLSKLIDEVASKISFEDFNNKPLSGKYLLGMYSQRHTLYQKKDKNRTADVADDQRGK